MKEITRIHIAKTPYDIEIDAKKELEKYIKQLEMFVDDQEVMADVEVRITELLAERGILKDGVVTLDDIHTMREQLGEPHDFAADDNEIVAGEEALVDSPRRLYRDTETAALGGVLGGIAKFFGINPLWTRLGFLVALLVSFGTAAIVYVVLWFVVPPARTAAEKLQLEGRPITLANMKELREQVGTSFDARRTSSVIKNIVIYGLGTLSAIGAITALIVTIWLGAGLVFGTSFNSPFANMVPGAWMSWMSYGLFVLSGLLLSTLGVIISYACFSKRLTKRIGVAVVAIILAGVMAFGSGLGSLTYESYQEDARINALRETTQVALSSDFAQVKRLSVSAHSASNEQSEYTDFTVQYVASTGTPRYVLDALPDIEPQISLDGDHARVVLKTSAMQNSRFGYAVPQLTIYGPVLDELTSEQGTVQYSGLSQVKQGKLVLRPAAGSTIDVHGVFGSLQIIGDGTVDARLSTTYALTTESTALGIVKAGVVERLSITQPTVCSAYAIDAGTAQNYVAVRGVTSGEMTYNGTVMPAKTHETSCGSVAIGKEDDDSRYND